MQNVSANFSYRRSAIFSLSLHVGIFLLLIISLYSSKSLDHENTMPSSIQASLVQTPIQKSVPAPVVKKTPTPTAPSPSHAREPAPPQKEIVKPLPSKSLATKVVASQPPPIAKKTSNAQQQKTLEESLMDEEIQNTLKMQKQKASKQLLDEQVQQEVNRFNQVEKQARSEAVQSEINQYATLIKQQISQNWIMPQNVDGLEAILEIQVAPGGMVLNIKTIHSSGNAAFDRSAIAAVNKASPLPVPKDAIAFTAFRQFTLTARPEGMSSSL